MPRSWAMTRNAPARRRKGARAQGAEGPHGVEGRGWGWGYAWCEPRERAAYARNNSCLFLPPHTPPIGSRRPWIYAIWHFVGANVRYAARRRAWCANRFLFGRRGIPTGGRGNDHQNEKNQLSRCRVNRFGLPPPLLSLFFFADLGPGHCPWKFSFSRSQSQAASTGTAGDENLFPIRDKPNTAPS